MTDTTSGRPSGPPAPKRKREILGPTGLVVMVSAILLFTIVSIVIEVVSNSGQQYRATVDVVGPIGANEVRVVFHVTNVGHKAGRPDRCEATLYDRTRERVGTAAVSLKEPIEPGETVDEQAVGTVAAPAVNGAVRCRSLEPD